MWSVFQRATFINCVCITSILQKQYWFVLALPVRILENQEFKWLQNWRVPVNGQYWLNLYYPVLSSIVLRTSSVVRMAIISASNPNREAVRRADALLYVTSDVCDHKCTGPTNAWVVRCLSKSQSKYFYSLKVKYNMTSEEIEIQSWDGYRNFIYIITVG